jgi:hypothetical protein
MLGTLFHLWNPTDEQCVVKHSLVETLLSIMKNITIAEHNSYHYTATKGNRLYLRSGLSLIKQVNSSGNTFGLHSGIILNLGWDTIFLDCVVTVLFSFLRQILAQ